MKWLVILVSVAVLLLGTKGDDDLDRDARFVAAYSTRTMIILTTTTATAVHTCNIAHGTNACQKRKVRRFSAISSPELESEIQASSAVELESALQELPEVDRMKRSDDSDRDGRLALTVWSTTSSTYTITSTSTNTATTLSLSVFCSIVGGELFPTCA